MTLVLALVFIALSTAITASPPQHLLPEESYPEVILDRSVDPSSNPTAYEARARSLLAKDIGYDATMVCLPSFEHEWAIGVGQPNASDKTVVTFREMDRQLWGAKRGSKPTFKQKVAPIDDRTAAMIRRCWERMLLETRYQLPSEEIGGLDGETYHFASGSGMSGYVWSPDSDTLPGKLVALAATLREFASAPEVNRPKLTERLRYEADELNRAVNSWPDRIVRQRDDAALTFLSHRSAVWFAVLSPDEKRLLTGTTNKDAIVWDTCSGEPLARFRGNNDWVNGGAWSPDGKLVVTTSTGGNIMLWDPTTGTKVRQFGTDKETAGSAAFSPDGKTIVTGEHGGATLWDVETGKMLRMFPIPGVFADDVAFSHNGSAVATGGADGWLRIFEAGGETKTLGFSADREQINRVVFSPDDAEVLTVGNYRRVKVWDAKTGTLVQSFEQESQSVDAAAFTSRGLRVSTEDENHHVFVWEVEGAKKLCELEGHVNRVNGATISRDGEFLVTCSEDQTAKLWNLP
jgi:WD40 repeat protein